MCLTIVTCPKLAFLHLKEFLGCKSISEESGLLAFSIVEEEILLLFFFISLSFFFF
jgi:hypothetical protein